MHYDIYFRITAHYTDPVGFIAGVTGSGKTTTCQTLLSGAGIPYLVIEPAKTEYRALMKSDRKLIVFTLGDESCAPFRLNPLEFTKGEIISSHIDMVIVDQIPNKLAPDVLKNTNTKIIHRILAKDDKEAVGDTMMMDDKQKEFLSALQVGHAVVFSPDHCE